MNAPADPPSHAPRIALAVPGILIGLFLAALDSTILSTAMPKIVRDIGGLQYYAWTFSVYLLMQTATVPVWGRLSDIYGRRRFLAAGIVIFCAGSSWCGAVHSMPEMIGARAVQGVGAGALLTVSFALLSSLFPPERRGAMMGLVSMVWGLSSILGPLIGGTLAKAGLWRWCFYINLPTGVLALALLFASRAGREGAGAKQAPDVPGAVLLVLSSLAFFSGIFCAQVGRTQWAAGALAVVVLLVALLVGRERSTSDPFVKYRLFGIRLFAHSAFSGFFASIGMFTAIVFGPLFVQGVLGESAMRGGLALTPFALCWTTFAAVSGAVINRAGYRLLASLGAFLMTGAYVGLSMLTPASGWSAIAALMAVIGAGLGLSVTSGIMAAQNAVEKSDLGASTSLVQFTRNVGAMTGISLLGALLVATLMRGGVAPEESRRLLDSLARAEIPAERLKELSSQLLDGLHLVFRIGIGVCAAAFAISITMPAGRPGDPKPAA